MIQSPCKDCQSRLVPKTCEKTCEKWNEYKKELEEDRDKVALQKALSINSYRNFKQRKKYWEGKCYGIRIK